MHLRLRTKGVEVSGIEVLDLSLAGCLIPSTRWTLREGQRVLVSLPDIASLPGAVLWVENGLAGLLFDQLLNERVYEHLLAAYALGAMD